jgi:hypothetical protein
MDILFSTSIGMLKYNITSLDKVNNADLRTFENVKQIGELINKDGSLFIDEVRTTYDNNMYILLSGKVIIAIEYIMNSDVGGSIQEMRLIDALEGANKAELDLFYELDLIALPV